MLNCEKSFMERINFRLFVDFIVPIFDGKTFDQYLIIVMVLSLANATVKRIIGEAKHSETKMLRNVEFGCVVQKLWSEKWAINGGSTLKYEDIGL